jgi:DNA sulfur modification protein DndB
MMPTYQRLIKKKRLQEVREFINDGGYFPNSIIISIDSGGKKLVFDQAGPKIPGSISKIGVLHIPKRYHSAYIIDGQHRLYGYSDSQYAATNSIPVVAFVDLDRTEQIKMFMDINENQKAVPKSLRVTLNADMLWDSDDFSEQRQALRSKIAQMLGEESTSPLQGRIVIGENESTPTKCITVEAMQAALKKTHFFSQYGKKNTLNKEGTFDCGNNQDSCDLFYPFIEKCLLYMREACLAEWEKGDNELGMLTINRGMQATIRVIDDIVNLLIEKGMVFPKMQSAEDIVEIVQYYLKPLAEYLNTLSTEQRKDLRGYFGGGADTRFWRAYQKAIADKRPDFKPEGLDEYWMNEAKTYNDDTKNLIPEIEARLKRIISDSLEECFGDNWLIKGLPRQVYTRLKNAADDKIYEFARNGIDDVEVSPWDFVTLPECKEIAIYGKNWSTLFDSTLVRPEDASISGGKEAKTDWILRINTIKNKLSKSSYSVSLEEFSMVSGVHEWITSFLLM